MGMCDVHGPTPREECNHSDCTQVLMEIKTLKEKKETSEMAVR